MKKLSISKIMSQVYDETVIYGVRIFYGNINISSPSIFCCFQKNRPLVSFLLSVSHRIYLHDITKCFLT